ncbi:MAG: glycosyltransferase family 87 protein [Patescibacteria group bacterium]
MHRTGIQPLDMYLPHQFAPVVRSITKIPGGTKFLYPPQAALFFAPLSFVPFKALIKVWLVLNTILFIATYYLAVWFFVSKQHIWDTRYSALLALLSFSPPVVGLLERGQVDGIVWTLLLLFTISLFRGKEVVGGIILGVLVAIKIFPILFFPYLLLKKKWKAAGTFVVTSLLLWLATIPFFGVGGLLSFWHYPFSAYLAGKINYVYTSISLYGTFRYVVHEGWLSFIGKKIQVVAVGDDIFLGISVLALLGTSYLVWQHRQEKTKWRYLLDYSTILIFLFLFSKSVQAGYLFWLLPLLIVLLSRINRHQIAQAIFFIFTLYLTQFWKVSPWINNPLLQHGPILGLVLVGGAVVWMQLTGLKPMEDFPQKNGVQQ